MTMAFEKTTAILADLFRTGQGSKYARITDAIRASIDRKLLYPGDRLPPQRELADALQVTLGTVTRGYCEAEKEGLILGETGRGTFIRHMEHDRFSLHSLHNMADRDREPLVPFDLNFPVVTGSPDLAAALSETAKQKELQGLLDYRPTAGLYPHRQAGCKWLARFGMEILPNNLVITAGGQHALHTVLLSQMHSGEALAVEQYTYPGVINLARFLGIRLVPVPMDRDGMIPEALASIARQHKLRGVYLMSTLQNPTTVTMPEHRRHELAAMIRSLDIFLVEDDVYAIMEQEPLTPVSASIPERAFYLTSLSKALAPGLRVGYLTVPDQYLESVEAAMAASIWMTPPLMAELASRWLEDGTAQRVAEIKHRETNRRLQLVRQHIPGVSMESRTGGPHLWLHLPDDRSAESFAARAAEQGVLVIPSNNFFPGPHPEHQAIRICIGPPPSDEQIVHGAKQLSRLLGEKAESGGPLI